MAGRNIHVAWTSCAPPLQVMPTRQNQFIYRGQRISLLFQIRWQVCCVFTITPLKIKMQSSWCKKCRIWEMKGANCTKCLAKNQVCAVIHRQDIQRTFCSNLTALYGDAMFVCLWRTLIWQLGTNRNIHSWVFKLWRKFIPWATHED